MIYRYYNPPWSGRFTKKHLARWYNEIFTIENFGLPKNNLFRNQIILMELHGFSYWSVCARPLRIFPVKMLYFQLYSEQFTISSSIGFFHQFTQPSPSRFYSKKWEIESTLIVYKLWLVKLNLLKSSSQDMKRRVRTIFVLQFNFALKYLPSNSFLPSSSFWCNYNR